MKHNKGFVKPYLFAGIAPVIGMVVAIIIMFQGNYISINIGQVLLLLTVPSLAISLIVTFILQRRKKSIPSIAFLGIGLLALVLVYALLFIFMRTTI